MAKDRNIKIYQAYIAAKNDKTMTTRDVCDEFHITRSTLYDIIRRIEGGNVTKIRKCTERSRLECLWKYKYQPRYSALPKNREKETVVLLKKLIKEMRKDKFPISTIATLLRKDRSTINHHLR